MISILMGVYNEEHSIARCLTSLQESLEDFIYEIIIIDDCSNDNTVEIIKSFNSNPNIKLYSNEKNSGLAKCLNTSFGHSQYPYLARIDADDVCMKNRFQIQIDFLQKNPNIDILGSNAYLMDKKGEVYSQTNVQQTHESILNKMKVRNSLIHPTVIMRRKAFEKLGGYDESLRFAQDYDLWLRGIDEGLTFANLKIPLIKYYVVINRPLIKLFYGLKTGLKYSKRNKSIYSGIIALLDFLVAVSKKYFKRK